MFKTDEFRMPFSIAICLTYFNRDDPVAFSV